MNLEAWRHYLRARLYRFLRKPEAAVAEYRLALGQRPDFAKAAHCLGILLATLKRHTEAEQYLRETVRIEPRNAAAWFNLGFLYHETHRPHEAIAPFEEALRLNPKLDRAWYGLGLCHATLGDHAQAARALERTAQLQPMNSHAWYHLGMAHSTLHNADKVKEVIEHLNRFDRKMTRRLILDAQRSDLAHLVADLKV